MYAYKKYCPSEFCIFGRRELLLPLENDPVLALDVVDSVAVEKVENCPGIVSGEEGSLSPFIQL